TTEMSLAQADVRDVPALDLVNHVQTEAVRAGIAGTEHAGLPVLSIAAPFNNTGKIPAGQVSVRDAASVYIYDNTLLAVELTGAQVRDFLEWSAGYFRRATGSGPYVRSSIPGTKPLYNYDVVSGVSYDIDITAPEGSRIRNLAFAGRPLDPAQKFAVAINNYRQNGGGGAPHVSSAPIIFNPMTENRQLVIDYVTAKGEIDPADFASEDWRLVAGDVPVYDFPFANSVADVVGSGALARSVGRELVDQWAGVAAAQDANNATLTRSRAAALTTTIAALPLSKVSQAGKDELLAVLGSWAPTTDPARAALDDVAERLAAYVATGEAAGSFARDVQALAAAGDLAAVRSALSAARPGKLGAGARTALLALLPAAAA
ncbi:5'-nucleotidase C-terminal domain-containing protein, partial [Motilibacter deserti]